jgi:hypothetical protein
VFIPLAVDGQREGLRCDANHDYSQPKIIFGRIELDGSG